MEEKKEQVGGNLLPLAGKAEKRGKARGVAYPKQE